MDDKIKGVIYKESYKKKDELVRNYARKKIHNMMINSEIDDYLLFEYLREIGFSTPEPLAYDEWCIDLIKDSIDIEDRRNCYAAIRMR